MKPAVRIIPLLVVAVWLMATGCRSSKSATTTDSYTPVQTIEPAIDTQVLAEAFGSLVGGYADWTDVKMPVTVAMTSPSKFKASGTITMVKDKYVNISVKVLGFEVAVIHIDNDSVYAQEKVHKYYVAESIANLLGTFPATVGNLQCALMGRLFEPGRDGTPDATRFTLTQVADPDLPQAWIIATAASDCSFVAQGFDAPALGGVVGSAGGNFVACQYDDMIATDSGTMAATTTVTAQAGNMAVSASVELSPTKGRWDSGATAQWKQPSNYKRITLPQLIKSLSSQM